MPRPLLLALLAVAMAAPGAAQSYGSVPPRIGVGFDVVTAVLSQDLIPEGPSLGLRGRVALPVNADLSVAASLGIGAHIFEGRSDTRYVLNPQAELVVTLPRGDGNAVRYVLGGFGGFVPLSGGSGGPTLHAGYGWAFPLLETSMFFEVNPSLVIGEDDVAPVLGARAGVIF